MNLDKLKVLASNEKELWEARKLIARRDAIKMGHDMSQWTLEFEVYTSFEDCYTCFCKKCIFELRAEVIYLSARLSHIKYNFDYAITKCTAI